MDRVGSWPEALSQLSAGAEYDFIIMDVQMPNMDGLETTRHIRNARAGGSIEADIPIFALTAHARQGDRECFPEAGIGDYFEKPCSMGMLMAAIARHARLHNKANTNTCLIILISLEITIAMYQTSIFWYCLPTPPIVSIMIHRSIHK